MFGLGADSQYEEIASRRQPNTEEPARVLESDRPGIEYWFPFTALYDLEQVI